MKIVDGSSLGYRTIAVEQPLRALRARLVADGRDIDRYRAETGTAG